MRSWPSSWPSSATSTRAARRTLAPGRPGCAPVPIHNREENLGNFFHLARSAESVNEFEAGPGTGDDKPHLPLTKSPAFIERRQVGPTADIDVARSTIHEFRPMLESEDWPPSRSTP